MKALVTGASGFICGYVVQELLREGYEVVVTSAIHLIAMTCKSGQPMLRKRNAC